MLPKTDDHPTPSTASAIAARFRSALTGTRRTASTAVAVLAMVLGIGAIGTPAAVAAPLSNPSLEVEVKCPGALAVVQVEWEGTRSARVHWTLTDTGADQKSPIIQVVGRNAPGDGSSWTFRNGHTWYSLDGGRGDTAGGSTGLWDPPGITQFNHLEVKVSNGTTAEGTACSTTKEMYNYSRIAYQYALNQNGDEYQLGATGPSQWDCSGLVWYTYQSVPNFPSWTRMDTGGQYDWARSAAANNNSDLSNLTSRDAIAVSRSNLKVGDLIFYNGHVSFYAGNGRAFSALNEAAGVGYNPVDWAPVLGYYRIVGVR